MRAILTYHSVDPSGSPISIDRESFERHVAFLASGAVKVMELEALLSAPDEPHVVAITFDDGFVNFDELAWPALRDAGLPATLFVPTARVGGDNRWDGRDEPGIPTLPLMDWERISRLASEGLSLGAHSRTHAHLDRVEDAQLHDEIEGSAEDLSARLGTAPRSFCYPYGDYDERVEAAVARRFALACTTELAALAADDRPHRLPRLDAFYLRDPGALEAFGGAAFRARIFARRHARSVRAWWKR